MRPSADLGPPAVSSIFGLNQGDQQVTIDLCRNCIARGAGWSIFPGRPGDIVMHTI